MPGSRRSIGARLALWLIAPLAAILGVFFLLPLALLLAQSLRPLVIG